MGAISFLDYTSVIILLVLELASISFRQFPTVKSRSFNMLLGDALLSTILAIGAAHSELHLPKEYVALRVIIQAFYTSTSNLLPLFFYIFIASLAYTNRRAPMSFWWTVFQS